MSANAPTIRADAVPRIPMAFKRGVHPLHARRRGPAGKRTQEGTDTAGFLEGLLLPVAPVDTTQLCCPRRRSMAPSTTVRGRMVHAVP